MISFKKEIIGNLEKYNLKNDFSNWYQKYLMAVDYLEYDIKESKRHLISKMEDGFVARQILQIMQAHPEADLEQLGVQIAIQFGAKSANLTQALAINNKRKEKESIHNWGMRARDSKQKEVLMHPGNPILACQRQ